MALTGRLYGKVFSSLWNAEIDYDTQTIKVAITNNSYTPDQDTHDYFNDITNEVSGTGYTAGGEALGTKTVTYTGATNKHVLDAADTVWGPGATIPNARNYIVYNASPGSDATRPLIGYQADSADQSVTAGTLTLAYAAAGLVEITVS